jgi:hypothetical protein
MAVMMGIVLTALLLCAFATRAKEPPPRHVGDWE